MVRTNQIIVDYEDDRFVCISCGNRHFSSAVGLFQHCRTSKVHSGEWCERCQWLFVNDQARVDHIRNSAQHWLCSFCNTDLVNNSELASHQIRVHDYCSQCHLLCEDYTEHRIEEHHQCRECGEEFQNSNNLDMHSQVHLPRMKECYGCVRNFTSESAMFDHLEWNTCLSGVNNSLINKWAFECFQHRHYTNDWDDYSKYRCPSCSSDFRFVSALLRHAESNACDANEDRSLIKMKLHIKRKVYEYQEEASQSTDSSWD